MKLNITPPPAPPRVVAKVTSNVDPVIRQDPLPPPPPAPRCAPGSDAGASPRGGIDLPDYIDGSAGATVTGRLSIDASGNVTSVDSSGGDGPSAAGI